MSSEMMPKKRGRPRKNPLPETVAEKVVKVLKDEEILSLVVDRFDVLEEMVKAMVDGDNRAMIVSGAPGIGKTYTVNRILEHSEKKGTIQFTKVSGFMTATMLYQLLWENRADNQIVMVDDCDSIFYSDDAANILKAALDTSEVRVISYRASGLESNGDDEEGYEGQEAPSSFEYQGRMIFTTNIDFNAFLEAGRNRMTPHIKALRDRCFYLDMKLHGERAVALWIRHMVSTNKMLQGHPHSMTKEQSDAILEYILTHRDRIPVMSLRTAVKAAGLVRINPDKWLRLADMTLCK